MKWYRCYRNGMYIDSQYSGSEHDAREMSVAQYGGNMMQWRAMEDKKRNEGESGEKE